MATVNSRSVCGQTKIKIHIKLIRRHLSLAVRLSLCVRRAVQYTRGTEQDIEGHAIVHLFAIPLHESRSKRAADLRDTRTQSAHVRVRGKTGAREKTNENKLPEIKIVTVVIAYVLSNNDKCDTLLYFEHMPAK